MKKQAVGMSLAGAAALFGVLAVCAPGIGQKKTPAPKPHPIDKFIEEDDSGIGKLVAKQRGAALKADPKALAKQKVEAAQLGLEANLKFYQTGRGRLDEVLKAAEHLAAAELEIAESAGERLAALERRWKVCTFVYETNKARYEAGRVPVQDLGASRYAQIEAHQKWLEAAKAIKK